MITFNTVPLSLVHSHGRRLLNVRPSLANQAQVSPGISRIQKVQDNAGYMDTAS